MKTFMQSLHMFATSMNKDLNRNNMSYLVWNNNTVMSHKWYVMYLLVWNKLRLIILTKNTPLFGFGKKNLNNLKSNHNDQGMFYGDIIEPVNAFINT